ADAYATASAVVCANPTAAVANAKAPIPDTINAAFIAHVVLVLPDAVQSRSHIVRLREHSA
ncbi:MAG TPA: hypothetical protein VK639_11845, partial [Terriglobales bacterium]|nr:hypothetical protein [Terriglobales bacterium]